MLSPAVALIGAVLVFGMALPYGKGLDFLDPIFILAYSCLGALFAAPAATEVLANGFSRWGLLLKMLLVWGYGWGVSVLLIASGILTVNLHQWHGRLITPTGTTLLAAFVLGAASCLVTIAAAALLARHVGPKAAKTILRLSFLALLLTMAVAFRFGPEAWRSTLEENLTSRRLTGLAFRVATVLAVAGAAMTAWTVRQQPILKGPPVLDRD